MSTNSFSDDFKRDAIAQITESGPRIFAHSFHEKSQASTFSLIFVRRGNDQLIVGENALTNDKQYIFIVKKDARSSPPDTWTPSAHEE